MPVAFQNYEFSYLNAKKKPVFVPSEAGRKIGLQIKVIVEAGHTFDPFFWHLREGGHVASMHEHRGHSWFARVDLQNFFYTVRRRQVQQALRDCGARRHEHFAKWSTVRNPFDTGGYVVPYGFVQSPIVASLVLSRSPLGRVLRGLPAAVTVGVYLDDISISANDEGLLRVAYDLIVAAVEPSGFALNAVKSSPPTQSIELFNCEMRRGHSAVLDRRIDEFYALPRSEWSAAGFENYRQSVAVGNTA